jgi:ArsR family transcriptional regulator, arsenate/arsenite/antimonite-responsive transcriptional repressor
VNTVRATTGKRRATPTMPRDEPTACLEPPEAPGPVEVPDDETLAAMAKAIGHPARIAILRLLAHRETCVTGDVVAELPLAQSTVSEHLRILREAGLIQGEIEGPRTRYCVNPGGFAALRLGVASL